MGRAGFVRHKKFRRRNQRGYTQASIHDPGRCGAAVALVVQKYGGSSVADADGIKRVAQRIVATRKGGDQVVVVVSAMGDSTDELMDLAGQVSPLPPARELDMLLTAGERISMALLAMAIANLGMQARSFTGSQAGVITDAAHGRARIIDIKPGRIADALADGAIPIVAGFQGVSQTTKDVTTMGRGASDTTAVALAAALAADACRDLHRRGRRLHRRSAHRAVSEADPGDQLRGNARDGRLRGKGPDAALRRIRAALRGAHPRAVLLHQPERNVGHGARERQVGGRPAWSRPSSPGWRTTGARRRSPWWASPTG